MKWKQVHNLHFESKKRNFKIQWEQRNFYILRFFTKKTTNYDQKIQGKFWNFDWKSQRKFLTENPKANFWLKKIQENFDWKPTIFDWKSQGQFLQQKVNENFEYKNNKNVNFGFFLKVNRKQFYNLQPRAQNQNFKDFT